LHGEPGQQMAVRAPLIEFEVEGAGNAGAEEPEAANPSTASRSPSPQGGEETAASSPPHASGEGDHPKDGGGAGVAPGANYVFKLPDVGEGTAEAELVGWRVTVGDAVAEDQILAEVMTDKATVEITSPVAGKVVALHGEPGKQMAVGGPLVSFAVEGKGNVAAAAPAPSVASGDTSPKGGGSTGVSPAPKSPPAGGSTREAGEGGKPRTLSARGERPLASPAVRNRARQLGVELQFVPGSGPAGRIEHGDLDAYIAQGARTSTSASTASLYAPAEGTTETRIIGLRRKIAEKMAESVRRIPHITYVEEIDVTALEELRAHLNAQGKAAGKPKLNVLPFIARAIVVALRDQPQINRSEERRVGRGGRADGA